MIVWCLTPFFTVFQLYRGGQCTYGCIPGVLLTRSITNLFSFTLQFYFTIGIKYKLEYKSLMKVALFSDVTEVNRIKSKYEQPLRKENLTEITLLQPICFLFTLQFDFTIRNNNVPLPLFQKNSFTVPCHMNKLDGTGKTSRYLCITNGSFHYCAFVDVLLQWVFFLSSRLQ